LGSATGIGITTCGRTGKSSTGCSKTGGLLGGNNGSEFGIIHPGLALTPAVGSNRSLTPVNPVVVFAFCSELIPNPGIPGSGCWLADGTGLFSFFLY